MAKTSIRAGGLFVPIAVQHGDVLHVPKSYVLESLGLTKQWLRDTLYECGLGVQEVEDQVQKVDWGVVYENVWGADVLPEGEA